MIRGAMGGVGRRFFGSFCALWLLAGAANAQVCEGKWQPGQGIPGVSGVVNAVVALANGDLVVGGTFDLAGGVVAHNVALYHPATGQFSPLGTGLDGTVQSLIVMPNGQVVAGGGFRHGSEVEIPYIGLWNGSEWSPLGTGLNNVVNALDLLPNGNLVAGGAFTQTAGGTHLAYVARWNGSAWFPLANGAIELTNVVNALVTLPNGNVIVGGDFLQDFAHSVTWNRVARWDGSTWNAMGTGIPGATGSVVVEALARMPNGDVVVGGAFSSAGGVTVSNVARWNGSAWSNMGTGNDGQVRRLRVRTSGTLVAAGFFSPTDGTASYPIAQWNGSSWSKLTPVAPLDTVNALASLADGELAVAGFAANGVSVAVLDAAGQAWQVAPGAGFSNPIRALVRLSNGDIVAGGAFGSVGGVAMNHIARWNGTSWLPLGTGINGAVESLAVLTNGTLVAGGVFSQAGGVAAANIAAWNGSTWSALGAGLPGEVATLLALDANDFVAGGSFSAVIGGVQNKNLAHWHSGAWLSDFGGGTSGRVLGLTRDGTNGIIAAGQFNQAGSIGTAGLAAFSFVNSSWFSLVSSTDGAITSVLELPSGDVIVGGLFSSLGGAPGLFSVARLPFFTTTWVPIGGGLSAGSQVDTVAVRPNGDIVVAGSFDYSGSARASGIALWNGSVWKRMGPGILDHTVYAVLPLPNNDVVVGGDFLRAGLETSAYYARFAEATGPDTDGDGSRDMCDVCPFVSDPNQTDSGGVGTSQEDGIGDACQCGDVTGDGVVDEEDWSGIRGGLAGFPYAVIHADHCSVSGAIDAGLLTSGMRRDCDEADAARIARALLGYGPSLGQSCAAAAP